ncbi:hypothetical protein CHS0354_036847, partial [Potamilus streckersoni]
MIVIVLRRGEGGKEYKRSKDVEERTTDDFSGNVKNWWKCDDGVDTRKRSGD